MESGLLLNVVVREGAAILKLLASEDEALLVRRDTLLVLDLGLDVVDGVGALDLKGDSLAGESLDEDLHTTAKTEDQVEGRLLLDVVVRQCAPVLELLASEDQALLVGRDTAVTLVKQRCRLHQGHGIPFFILNLGLNVINRIRGLNLEGDGLSGEGLHEDLHTEIRDA